MEIADLTHDEKLALIGLLKAVIRADQEFSSEEADELKKIGQEMGNEVFKTVVREAILKFKTLDELKEFSQGIQRQEARELIFHYLYEMALPGTIVPAEARVLKWLVQVWDLDEPAKPV